MMNNLLDYAKKYVKDHGIPVLRKNQKKYNKYKNVKIRLDDIVFDSTNEAVRYVMLKFMESEGEISNLSMQVKFPLLKSRKLKSGKTERGCEYICDFMYNIDGEIVVEDVKSERTKKIQSYILKRKMMLHFYGIEIKEVILKR